MGTLEMSHLIFIGSSGKYGETALSWQPRLYNRGEVGINDMQLREEIRKGDQINLIQFSSDTPTKTVIKTTILTDQDIFYPERWGYNRN